MHVETDVVAEAMNEILAQRLAVQIFAVGVDVVVGDLIKRIRIAAFQVRLARFECGHRRLLRAQDDVVDLPLARGEMAVHGKRARDVGGVHGVFAGRIDDDNVSRLHGG